MKSFKTYAIAGAFGAAMAMTAGTAFAECSAGDYKGCRSEERRVGKEGRSRWSPDH